MIFLYLFGSISLYIVLLQRIMDAPDLKLLQHVYLLQARG